MKAPRFKQRLRQYSPHPWTLLAGVLIVAAFPPWNLWPLLWVALIPWFMALEASENSHRAFVQGIWLSIVMSLGGFYWVAFVLQEFGNLPWSLSILGLFLFSIGGQPQFLVFAPLYRLIQIRKPKQLRYGLAQALFLTVLYTGLDWFAPRLFMDTLGQAFYLAKNLRQIADIGGTSLLTFFAFFVNYSLWISYKTLKNKKFHLKDFSPLVASVLLCTLGVLYGVYRNKEVSRILNQNSKTVQFASIQANIGDFDKLASEKGVVGAANKVLDTFFRLSDEAMKLTPKPDLVVWPETSYPSTFRNPHSHAEVSLDLQLETYRQQLGVPLLFGGYDHEKGKDFNAFFYLTPRGDLEIYQKNILLLFGEYIPGAESIDYIKQTFPQVGNFGRGKGPQVIPVQIGRPEIGPIQTAPIICYEALFPRYLIASARMGSQVIVNITNDSWFGRWGEPQLHLALSVFRSIETRLPMVRSTNTGVSALITSLGEITHATGIGTQEILNVSVPITDSIPTLMKVWGDWFGPTCLGISLLLSLIFFRASLKKLKKAI